MTTLGCTKVENYLGSKYLESRRHHSYEAPAAQVCYQNPPQHSLYMPGLAQGICVTEKACGLASLVGSHLLRSVYGTYPKEVGSSHWCWCLDGAHA